MEELIPILRIRIKLYQASITESSNSLEKEYWQGRIAEAESIIKVINLKS